MTTSDMSNLLKWSLDIVLGSAAFFFLCTSIVCWIVTIYDGPVRGEKYDWRSALAHAVLCVAPAALFLGAVVLLVKINA